jgi:hypothetical protein
VTLNPYSRDLTAGSTRASLSTWVFR